MKIRVAHIAEIPFDNLLTQKQDEWLFVLPDGNPPYSLVGLIEQHYSKLVQMMSAVKQAGLLAVGLTIGRFRLNQQKF